MAARRGAGPRRAPEYDHAWCSELAEELGLLVISVDYRLAPENPFPAGLDDCLVALRWLHAEAQTLGLSRDRLAVGGASAGGGLAAALAQRATDEGLPVAFQLLLYPMLDDRTVLRRDHAGRGRFGRTNIQQNSLVVPTQRDLLLDLDNQPITQVTPRHHRAAGDVPGRAGGSTWLNQSN